MRTIKRKRIFGGGKSIHKKKHKRSLKHFRGGVEPNYLTHGTEIYKVKGILGHQKPGPLYKDEDNYEVASDQPGAIVEITEPTEHNLFKGNIKHDNGAVILTDYKPLNSIKIGWIYGGHFGNIVIYSSANKLNEVIGKINPFLFKNDTTIAGTLFVREIDEEVIKFCENSETLKNEISPWESMTQEFDFIDDDLDNGDIDKMFKSILIKYYEEKINGISKDKIKALLDSVKIDDPQILTVRKSPDLLNKYKNILQRRNKSFVKQFSEEYISDNIPTAENWKQQIPAEADDSKPENYPDIYKKINALRLKQEMIYKESTDIFSIYISIRNNKEIYPFNIKYFLYDVIPNPKSNTFINRVIDKFKGRTDLFNNRCYKCISKIMYILQLFNRNYAIYRADAIVRYKQITDNDFDTEPKQISEFFELPAQQGAVANTAPPPLPGFRDFLNGYVINSLIDPVIMARLLSFNIQTKATILLSCISDHDRGTNYGGQHFNKLTNLDIEHKNDFYKSIDDDELRLKIKRLKIDDKEITNEDLENAKSLQASQASQTKVEEFANVLDGAFETERSIECTLDATELTKTDLIIELNCKCKIYRKDIKNQTNIMIYLFDKDEKSKFTNVHIDNLLKKQKKIDEVYNITDKHLNLYDDQLFDVEENENYGHENFFYDLIL